MSKSLLLYLFFICFSIKVQASADTLKKNIDISRLRYHESIDKEQRNALFRNGGNGQYIRASSNEDINLLVTDAIIRQVNELQDSIELSKQLDHRLKVKYLSGLENLLKGFNIGWKNRTLNAAEGPELVANYKA